MSTINEQGMRQDEIQQLTDREKARTSTSMYLGGTAESGVENSESMRTAVREAYDNSKNELLKGNGNIIWIFTDEESNPLKIDKFEGKSVKKCTKWIRYTVGDNASGIPIKAKEDLKHEILTMAEIAVSNFGAGSNFHKDFRGISEHGTGVAATNFTSAEFIIYSHLNCHNLDETTDFVKELVKEKGITKDNKEGWYYKITFNLGIKVAEEIVKYDDEKILVDHFYDASCYPSTVTSFIPDPTIHGSTVAEINLNDFAYLGFLIPKAEFYFNHERIENNVGYQFHNEVTIETPYEAEEGVEVKNPNLTFTYSFEPSDNLFDFKRDFSINTLSCQQGKHVKVWDECYTKAFCDYFNDWEIQKYATWGINVVLIFQCNSAQYNSQTKEKCSGVPGWYMNAGEFPELVKSITKILKKNNDLFTQQYNRIREYYESKLHLGKMKELQQTLGAMAKGNNKSMSAFMPQKLIPCTSKDRANCSVIICEGNSASGGLVKGRKGRDNFAIMGLRGKLLNVVGRDVNDALQNAEIYDLTHIFGGVDDLHMDLDKLPFGRYIIGCDEDSDGKQIASLVLGVIMQNHKFLFGTEENDYNDSRVFIAKAALYGFFDVDGVKGTHQYFYAGDEEKVAEFQKNHTYKAGKRWKGLGEMNPDEISMMYYDDDTARLLQVRPDNIEDALALIGQTEWKKDLMIEKGIISKDILDLTNASIIGD